MADSLLNHSWPSFSRRWMKRWSFKRGSECKPARGFTSSVGAVPASGCSTPTALSLSPSLIAEEEVFFGSMAEEREDASSPEADPCLANIQSSMEDLLSLDSALQGSEYYKDLGLTGPAEAGSAAPAKAPPPEWTSHAAPVFWSLMEMPPGIPGPDPGSEKASCHYLDADCACSCGSRHRDGLGREEGELQGGEETLLAPVKSSPTSRRHSWESPVSPAEAQRRLSLDASTLERENKSETLLPPSLPLPWAGPAPWTGGSVIQVELEPLCLDLGFQLEPCDVDYGSSGKWLRDASVPSPSSKTPSQQIHPSPEALFPISLEISPPALEIVDKEHMAPEQVLIVQQVLAELKQHHRNAEATGKSDKAERTTKVKRRLSSLRSRVTGSWQKEKGKKKDWEKEAKEQRQAMHGRDCHRRWGGLPLVGPASTLSRERSRHAKRGCSSYPPWAWMSPPTLQLPPGLVCPSISVFHLAAFGLHAPPSAHWAPELNHCTSGRKLFSPASLCSMQMHKQVYVGV